MTSSTSTVEERIAELQLHKGTANIVRRLWCEYDQHQLLDEIETVHRDIHRRLVKQPIEVDR